MITIPPQAKLPLLLRQGRAISGLSQAELARAAGLARITLARYETGARPVPPEVVQRLLRALVETDPTDTTPAPRSAA